MGMTNRNIRNPHIQGMGLAYSERLGARCAMRCEICSVDGLASAYSHSERSHFQVETGAEQSLPGAAQAPSYQQLFRKRAFLPFQIVMYYLVLLVSKANSWLLPKTPCVLLLVPTQIKMARAFKRLVALQK